MQLLLNAPSAQKVLNICMNARVSEFCGLKDQQTDRHSETGIGYSFLATKHAFTCWHIIECVLIEFTTRLEGIWEIAGTTNIRTCNFFDLFSSEMQKS